MDNVLNSHDANTESIIIPQEEKRSAEGKKKNLFKIFLPVFLVILLLGIVGLGVYEYLRIAPRDVRFTNITSSSVTVSWNTKSSTSATALVFEGDTWLPITLFGFGGERFYDTRDVRIAELKATEETGKNIIQRDGIEISMEEFETEITVEEMESYYTHHVTVTGLNPEKEYSFMVGDTILHSRVKDHGGVNIVKTLKVPTEINAPFPAYGRIQDAQGSEDEDMLIPVSDGVVYFNLKDEFSGNRSTIYSSVLNEDGNWYLDISGIKVESGDDFLSGNVVANVVGEVSIDTGPSGRWEGVLSSDVIAPAEMIVINDPLQMQIEGVGIKRVDANLLGEFTSKLEATGCVFAGFCGPCYEGVLTNSCPCPQSTLDKRCKGEESGTLETAISGVTNAKAGCVGGNPGQYVYFDGACRQCSVYQEDAEGEIISYRWTAKGVDDGKCESNKDGRTFDPPLTPSKDDKEDEGKCANLSVGDRCRSWDTTMGSIPEPWYCTSRGGSCVKDGASCGEGKTWYRGECGFTQNNNKGNGDGGNEDELEGSAHTCYQYKTLEGKCIPYKGTESTCPGGYKSLKDCEEAVKGSNLLRIEGGDDSNKDEIVACKPIITFLKKCQTNKGIESKCNMGGQCLSDGDGLISALIRESFPFRKGGELCNTSYPCMCKSRDQVSAYPIVGGGTWCPHIKKEGGCEEAEDGLVCKASSDKHICENGKCVSSGSVEGIQHDDSSRINILDNFVSEALSSEGEEYSNYVFDMETGIMSNIQEGQYTFTYEGETYAFDIISGEEEVLVFIDKNHNGQYDEGVDVKISEIASQIKIMALNQTYSYQLREGFNFISFPFLMPDEKFRTVAGLLKELNEVYGDIIFSISKYDGGRWKIVGQNTVLYSNDDFQLLPGQGYVIKARRDTNISILGQPIKYDSSGDSAPVALFEGWNLIGLYGTRVKTYTARSMIADINASDFTADNVSRWEKDKQMYDGLQVSKGQEYGFDFPINQLDSYFIRIKKGRGNWQPKLGTQ